MTTLTPEQLQAAAKVRVRQALDRIQESQHEIKAAMEQLSAVHGASHHWSAASKLHDRVRAFWYRLDRFHDRGDYRLDDNNAQALQRQMDAVAAEIESTNPQE